MIHLYRKGVPLVIVTFVARCQLISFLIVTFDAKVGHSPYWTNLRGESCFSELVGTFVQNGSAVNYGFNWIAVILRPQSMPSLLAE